MEPFSMAKNWWQFIIMAVLSYCMGCINIARIIASRKKKDIAQVGSGNPGTLNMTREFGWKMGLLTFVFDAFKGGVCVLVAHLVYKNFLFANTMIRVSDFTRYYCGLFAVLGHILPAVYHFNGGKGIATTFGVFWVALSCETPWYILIVFGAFLCVLAFITITEWGSLGNLLATAIFSVIQMVTYFYRYENQAVNGYLISIYMLVFAFTLITWCAHQKNLFRLFSGEEHRTSLKKIVKKKTNEKGSEEK